MYINQLNGLADAPPAVLPTFNALPYNGWDETETGTGVGFAVPATVGGMDTKKLVIIAAIAVVLLMILTRKE